MQPPNVKSIRWAEWRQMCWNVWRTANPVPSISTEGYKMCNSLTIAAPGGELAPLFDYTSTGTSDDGGRVLQGSMLMVIAQKSCWSDCLLKSTCSKALSSIILYIIYIYVKHQPYAWFPVYSAGNIDSLCHSVWPLLDCSTLTYD